MIKVMKMRKYFNQQKNQKINYVLVFVFFVILFSVIYLSIPQIVSNYDPLFHIKYSQLIREQGLKVINNFQWIYYSEQARGGSRYYVTLFHFLLIPFTFFQELAYGIKIAGIFFASLIMTTIYWWLKKIKIKYAFIILLFFWSLAPQLWTWRLFLTRPLILMIFFILLEIYFLWKRKYFIVFLLAVLHIFNHNLTFYFPLFLAFVFFIFNKLHLNKTDWKLLLSSFLGTIVGMMTLPDFPKSLIVYPKLLFSIIESAWQRGGVKIPQGAELYGWNLFELFYQNYLLVGILLFFIILRIIYYVNNIQRKRKIVIRSDFFQTDKKTMVLVDSLLVLNIIFLIGIVLSKRFIDFWVPIALIYFVLMFKIIFSEIKINIKEENKRIFVISSKFFVIVMIIYLVSSRAFALNSSFANQKYYNIMEGPAMWLKNNTEQGEIIFMDNWSHFPGLFYYNSKDYYIMGMEPRLLFNYDKKLYYYWHHIVTRGLPCNQADCQYVQDEIKGAENEEIYANIGRQIASAIKNEFKSTYILTSRKNSVFTNILKHSEYFETVYVDSRSENFIIFKINIEKLEENIIDQE
jgi:hypothetical protein